MLPVLPSGGKQCMSMMQILLAAKVGLSTRFKFSGKAILPPHEAFIILVRNRRHSKERLPPYPFCLSRCCQLMSVPCEWSRCLRFLRKMGWVVCTVLSGQPNRCRNGNVACCSTSSTIVIIWSPSIEFVSAPIIIHLDPSHIRTF